MRVVLFCNIVPADAVQQDMAAVLTAGCSTPGSFFRHITKSIHLKFRKTISNLLPIKLFHILSSYNHRPQCIVVAYIGGEKPLYSIFFIVDIYDSLKHLSFLFTLTLE